MVNLPFLNRSVTVGGNQTQNRGLLYLPFLYRSVTVQPVLFTDTLTVITCIGSVFQFHRTPITVISDHFSVCMALHWLEIGGTPPYYNSHY